MPIILTPTPSGRVEKVLVDLNGLEFNADSLSKVHTLDGWWDTVAVDQAMEASGGPGAVATGAWVEKERYLTVGGHTLGGEPFAMRRLLIAAFPNNVDSPITVTYRDGSRERLWVRPYDKLDLEPKGHQLRFTLPLVALDPWKYNPDPVAGAVGTSGSQVWVRRYADAGSAKWVRSYTLQGGRWVRRYARAVSASPYPESVALTSNGDATSTKMTVCVTGPLTAGEWWLLDETTGRQLWADVTLAEGQSVVFDCRTRTATINGAPVDHQVFGDWLRFAPGQNTFRLISATPTDAFAVFEALEAYQ